MNPVSTAAEVRDQWVAGLTPPATANGAQGAAGEHLVLHLLRTTSIPILRPNPERTWVWSDLHLGDRAMLEARDRLFRNVRHMNRVLLAEWRPTRAAAPVVAGELGDVAADVDELVPSLRRLSRAPPPPGRRGRHSLPRRTPRDVGLQPVRNGRGRQRTRRRAGCSRGPGGRRAMSSVTNSRSWIRG